MPLHIQLIQRDAENHSLLSFKRTEVCLKHSSQQGSHRKTGSWILLSWLLCPDTWLGVLIYPVKSQTVWILVCVRDIFTISLVTTHQRIPLSLWQWCDDPLALCHCLENFALRHYLFLIPSFCAFTGSEWFCSHRTGTQHFLHPSVKILWKADQCPDPTSGTQLHTVVLMKPSSSEKELPEWQLSHCAATALAEEFLPSWSLQAGSNNWLQRIKWTQNFLQSKTLSLPINFSTHWKK